MVHGISVMMSTIFTTFRFRTAIRPVLWLAVLALCACSTSANKDAPSREHSSDAPVSKPVFSPVTFTREMSPAGEMLRAFGEQAGGGFVLMSGLEERTMSKVDFHREPYEQAVARFAEILDCTFTHTPYYYFILPPAYKALEMVSLADNLDARYTDMTVSAVFGAKTDLYVVFAALSESLGVTIVADNFITESYCGELHLPEAPLAVVLEAILQSARFSPDTLRLESTPDYIFLYAAQNENKASLRLDTGPLTAEQQALLDKEVSLSLPIVPEDKEGLLFSALPIPLHEALYPLSEQLGIEVTAQRQLGDIPINPVVFKRLRLETAMDLLLRQWPLAQFGWELQTDRILIRER